MKRLPRFLLIFIILFLFAFLLSVIYHMRVDKVDKMWLIYTCLKDILLYLPLISTLSILWSLVFRSKNEMSGTAHKTRFFFLFFFYVLFSFAFAFFMNEFAIPKLEERTYIQMQSKKMNLKIKQPQLKDATKEKFGVNEFKNLQYFPYRSNVSFAMGRLLVFMERLYNADGVFYATGIRVIALDKAGGVYYIITAPYAKEVDNVLWMMNSTYREYKQGRLVLTRQVAGKNRVPLTHEIQGIYNLNPGLRAKDLSMLDLFLYNNFVYDSKINFYRLGNVVYNKVSYYVIMIVLLIVASSVGWALRNARITTAKDIFPMVSFYLVSFILTTFAYDTLIGLMNMIYGLVSLS